MDIGVLGGTFDPLHNGHLQVAATALEQLSLDEIVFVPAGEQWLKSNQYVSAAKHRISMVQKGIEENPLFTMSTVDTDRSGPTYTVDTIKFIQAQRGEQARIFFIVGMDSIVDLPLWHDPHRLISLCFLAAFPRPGIAQEDIKRTIDKLPELKKKLIVLTGSQIDISATELRRHVAKGNPITDKVPVAVDEYIRSRGLYIKDGMDA
ncbi:MAG: nicotinate-nucleotide adenylyltransferase [SAR202 cluster bacterium]|nr:nicotinate-nucleotide adenylyltransferase [SAR202 cluster bacterium]